MHCRQTRREEEGASDVKDANQREMVRAYVQGKGLFLASGTYLTNILYNSMLSIRHSVKTGY